MALVFVRVCMCVFLSVFLSCVPMCVAQAGVVLHACSSPCKPLRTIVPKKTGPFSAKMRQQIMTLMCVWCARRLVNGFALIAPRARIFLNHRIWKNGLWKTYVAE